MLKWLWPKLKLVALPAMAILAPAKATLLTVFTLVYLDFVTGIAASHKRGIKITSRGMKATTLKLLAYETVILSSFLVGEYLTGPIMPIMNLVAGVIGLTELKSVIENVDLFMGKPVAKEIVSKLKELTSSSTTKSADEDLNDRKQ